jgi:hypothetical protein
MLRTSAFLLLTVLFGSGCTNLQPASADMYCLVDSGKFCAEIQGSGDCQPCQSAQKPDIVEPADQSTPPRQQEKSSS